MFRNLLLFIFCIFISRGMHAQIAGVVTDTALVYYNVIENDTSYLIRHVQRFRKYEIYYDSSFTKPAFFIQYNQYEYDEMKTWYRNGQQKEIINYDVKDHLGAYQEKSWYADGKLRSERICNSDSCEYFEYYNSGRLKKKNVDYSDTSRGGAMVWVYGAEYFENGQLECTPFYPNSDKRYTVTCYYASGRKQKQFDWWNGEVGPYVEWYENGKTKEAGQYEVNHTTTLIYVRNKTGTWVYYDEKGNKTREEEYVADGTMRWKDFDANGKVKNSGEAKE